jgi:hypothetical protein
MMLQLAGKGSALHGRLDVLRDRFATHGISPPDDAVTVRLLLLSNPKFLNRITQ